MSNEEEGNRTYEDILRSFITELNNKGLNLKYEDLDEQRKLELLDALSNQCKKHIRPFCEHVCGDTWYWFMDVWWNAYLDNNAICNVAARGLGKSHFWTKRLPQYLNFVKKGFRTTVSSFNEPATFDFLKEIRDDIEHNHFLITKMPESKSSDWNKGNLDFRNTSRIKGISITSQIRRLHEHFFICDDILNDESDLSTEQAKSKIYGTILPTLQRKRGKFAIVGTRFSEDDIYSYMFESSKDEKDYRYVEIRIELDEENEIVYLVLTTENGEETRKKDSGVTDIYDFNRLRSMRKLQPNYFAREYECRVVSDHDIPFPGDSIKLCFDKDLSYEDYATDKIKYLGALDSSNSTSKRADSTVLMYGYVDDDKNYVLSHIYEDNKLETPQRMEEIKRVMDNFKKHNVLAEQNSMGLTNVHMLNNEGYNLTPLHLDRTKKIDYTDYASLQIKQSNVRIPYKTAKDQMKSDKLFSQLTGVRSVRRKGGNITYDGTTAHDDFYSAFILLLKNLSHRNTKPTSVISVKRQEKDNI